MSLAKKWILTVDDDSNDRFWMQEAIATASVDDFQYELTQARNVAEARTLLTRLITNCGSLDEIVIFSDVNMPRESGLDFLKWLKEQPTCHGIPVVIVSSFDRQSEIARAFELGAVACMFKPPQARAVKGLLRTITQMYRAKTYLDGAIVLDPDLRESVITSPHDLSRQPTQPTKGI